MMSDLHSIISETNSLIELYRIFPTEESCYRHLEKIRWDGFPENPYNENNPFLYGNLEYKCIVSGNVFTVRTHTMFDRDNNDISLQNWFFALWLCTKHKKLSINRLMDYLNVSNEEAKLMMYRIKEAFSKT